MKKIPLPVVSLALFGAFHCLAQAPVAINTSPSRIVGHPKVETNGQLASYSPNLVEGRELWGPQGVALDTSVTPPVLYVADTFNNRVLAWKNATDFRNGIPADLVIGQVDLYHTTAQGPGIGLQTGLYNPTGLAVSKNGDLYVADTNNNRILRYPKPFANAGNVFPDLYIGQPSLNSRTANYTGQVDKQGISLTGGLAGAGSSLAFDSAGNLWITDPGNRRVLRFKASDIAGTGGPLTADLEIGQPLGFSEVRPALTQADLLTGNVFATPLAIGFDPGGRLFVTDTDASQINRVLVFAPPFTSNAPTAARIMGVFGPGQTPTQDQFNRTIMLVPGGIFFIPGSGQVGVLDTGLNRILLFDAFTNWPAQSTSYSPQAIGSSPIGQTSFVPSTRGNAGSGFTPAPSSSTLYLPSAAAISGTELYVSDSGNNRVVGIPFQGTTFRPANAVWGQDRFDMSAPNLLEGREFYFTNATQSSAQADAGIALDMSGDTPHLYVSDPFNNRVLGFNDFRSLKAGASADVVIGQADMASGLCNGTGDPNHPTQSSLCHPTGVLVDANGNLYVADSFNGRVLRFPAPFAHKGAEQADLVLGQHNFTTIITDPTASTMARPYGLAFAGSIGLLVSDSSHNRVLFFPFNSGGTFDPSTDSGKAATKVFGQPDFNSSATGTSDASLNSPHHIAT
ncbi:MAG TPA: NHL repeat-containing protein, partial [Bryobacteraceae bacterium]